MPALLGAVLLAVLVSCGGQGNQTVPPAAPGSVNASPVAGGVRVVWVDQSTNESEFVVYRADGDTEDAEYAEIARVPANSVMHEDFDVEMDGAYLYSVAATNQAGTSDRVMQDPPDPVSPAVGVRLRVTFDGQGEVIIAYDGKTLPCSSACSLGLALGSTVSLSAAAADGAAFAGWAGACSGAGTCTFAIHADADVEARFATHALTLVATGDSPVDVVVSPADKFGSTACTLTAGQTCAFGYEFESALKVSANSTVLEPQATFGGYGGACISPQGRYCLFDVDGATTVEIAVVRAPAVTDRAYQGLEDVMVEVSAAEGVLNGVSDTPGDSHTAVVVNEPATGTLQLFADGSFQYQGAPDTNGSVSFEFLARDALGNESAPATATVTVQAVNDAPTFLIAADPQPTVGNGVQVSIPSFATAVNRGGGSDEDSQTLAFSLTRTSGPADLLSAGPTLTITGATATLTYTPAIRMFGSATYQVSLKDNGGVANGGVDTSLPASVTFTVTPVTLTLNATAGGTLNPAAGVHQYGYGTDVNVQATAATDYQFAGWTGACTGFTNPCALTMTANRTLSAAFAPFVRVRPTNGFYFVNSSPAGISDCTAFFGVCDFAFPMNQVVTLSTDNPRNFSGVVCTQANPTAACTFTVTGPVTITID